MNIFRKNSLVVAILIGLAIASVVTVYITIWEWLENPSGIFHDQYGTNWAFVYDTASSWFVPTFINASIVSLLTHLAFKGILWLRKHRQ